MAKMYRINEQDEYQGVVFQTKDYSKFKHLDGNRAVTEGRKAKIRRSVQANGQIFTVITCNEKMQVIDGQGRVEVFKELGLPVCYVIVPGLGAKDCAVLNAATTAWKTTDYIDMYCDLNNVNYLRLRALIESHKMLSLNTVLYAINGIVDNYSDSRKQSAGRGMLWEIRNGEFTLGADKARNVDLKLEYAERFLPGFRSTGRKELVMSAAVFAYDNIPDRERLVDKWNKYSTIKSVERPAASMADVMKMLEACYNYKSSAKDSYYIATEYERWAKARGANK